MVPSVLHLRFLIQAPRHCHINSSFWNENINWFLTLSFLKKDNVRCSVQILFSWTLAYKKASMSGQKMCLKFPRVGLMTMTVLVELAWVKPDLINKMSKFIVFRLTCIVRVQLQSVRLKRNFDHVQLGYRHKR